MKKLTVIVPCYNEEESLPFFYEEISKIANQMKALVLFEVIYINDGSSDQTLKVLQQIRARDSRMKYLSFSRNFGKEAAMYAGLEYATGDYVAIMMRTCNIHQQCFWTCMMESSMKDMTVLLPRGLLERESQRSARFFLDNFIIYYQNLVRLRL